MRLPSKEKGQECTAEAVTRVESAYLEATKNAARPFKKNVMNSEGRAYEVETFDPERVRGLFATLPAKLSNWQISEPQRSLTDGLGRMYCQLSTEVKKYALSGYLGLQFHEVPYYAVDKRVPDAKRQLELLAEKGAPLFEKMSSAGDKAIMSELKRRNVADLDFEKLFTLMFEDERFLSDLESIGTSIEQSFEELQRIKAERDRLYSQLDGLVTYVYQTSPVLIDYNRLISGEEGAVIYFDLNLRKGAQGGQETNFDLKKVPAPVIEEVCSELQRVARCLETVSIGK